MSPCTLHITLTLAFTCVISTTAVTDHDDAYTQFEAAIGSSSPECRATITTCLIASPGAVKLYDEERYCDLMHYNQTGMSSHDCLVARTKSCTQKEFDRLESVACDACSQFVYGCVSLVICALVSWVVKD